MTVGFLCSEASLFPPFSSHALEKEVTMCSLHLRRELGSTSSREVYLHNLFKILLHGWFIWSPFNHLFISVWNHGYLLLTLGYGPVWLYFVAKIVLMLTSFSWLLCHLNAPLVLWTFLLILGHARTFWRYGTPHTPLVNFLLQPWNQPFLQGAWISFIGEWC